MKTHWIVVCEEVLSDLDDYLVVEVYRRRPIRRMVW